MTQAQLRHRILLKLKQFKGTQELDFDNSKELINAMIDEGSREFLHSTLMLENLNASLTYNSTYDGCSLPSDFMRVKYLEWRTTDGFYGLIQPTGIEHVRQQRNEWKDLSDEEAKEIAPKWYTIYNNYIVLDSESTSSPALYYYKYDAVLTNTTSPAYPTEYHKYLIDYVIWQLTGDNKSQAQWEYGIKKALGTKRKAGNMRSRYIDM